MTSPQFIDAIAAGQLVYLHPGRMIILAKRGLVPCYAMPDGEFRFVAAELLEWAAQHRQPALPESVTDLRQDIQAHIDSADFTTKDGE